MALASARGGSAPSRGRSASSGAGPPGWSAAGRLATGPAATVTGSVARARPERAVTVAVPSPTATTRPSRVTAATVRRSLSHSTRAARVSPSTSSRCASTGTVSPGARVTLAWDNLREARSARGRPKKPSTAAAATAAPPRA